jgi:hypothetical protein
MPQSTLTRWETPMISEHFLRLDYDPMTRGLLCCHNFAFWCWTPWGFFAASGGVAAPPPPPAQLTSPPHPPTPCVCLTTVLP